MDKNILVLTSYFVLRNCICDLYIRYCELRLGNVSGDFYERISGTSLAAENVARAALW